MKWKIILFIIAILIISGFFYFHHDDSNSQKIHIFIGETDIIAEVADTPEERTLGLGGRDNLQAGHGMLFVFAAPGKPGFWMKDTNFPLDFIWIDQNKKIVDITPNVEPASFPNIYYPDTPVQYVLEIKAGTSEKYHFEVGQEVDF